MLRTIKQSKKQVKRTYIIYKPHNNTHGRLKNQIYIQFYPIFAVQKLI